jgi:hypothetical protein
MQPIKATGTKGFLMWLKEADPVLYAKVGQAIIAKQKKINGIAALPGMGCMNLQGLGDDLSTPPTMDFSMDTSYLDTAQAPVDVSIQGGGTDVASMASSAPTSNAIAATITGIANAYTSATLTNAQIAQNNTLLQTNLARAQQGLPPITSAGTLVAGATSSTVLLLGGGALLLLMMMGKKAA